MYMYMYRTQVKKPGVLKKYDEEIEGEKKCSFALGEWLYRCQHVLYGGLPLIV